MEPKKNNILKIQTEDAPSNNPLDNNGNFIITNPRDKAPVSDNDKNADEQQVESLTEKQLKTLDTNKFDVMGHVYLDKAMYLILELDKCHDYSSGAWHYVPRRIKDEYKHLYNNKNFCIEIFANSDKNVQRRLIKLIRRYNAGRKVELIKIHE